MPGSSLVDHQTPSKARTNLSAASRYLWVISSDEVIDTGLNYPVPLHSVRPYCVRRGGRRPVAACRPGCRPARLRCSATKPQPVERPLKRGCRPQTSW